MAKFMFVFHQTPHTFVALSPSEAERTFAKYQGWIAKIREKGRFVASEKLREEGGKILAVQKGRLAVVDGPYSEAKELVGGYLTIRAENYEEAVELARDCPHLAFGRIEIRQTDDMGCGGE